MADTRSLCEGLDVEIEPRRLTLATDGRPVAAFGREAVDGVIAAGIVFPNGRIHDATRHPRTIGRRLRDEARRRRLDPNRWRAATIELLVEHHGELDLDTLVDPTDLDRVCALLGFPLVRLAAAAGVDVALDVPAWAAPALRAAEADAAFATLFERPITRGLRRAMRAGLLAGAADRRSISLAPLGLASTLPSTWPADHVATILRGQGWLPPASRPTVEQRTDLRRVWRLLPADVGVRLANEALATPTGITELWSGLRQSEAVLANGAPPPTTIERLHDLAAAEAARHRVPARRPDPPRPAPRRAPAVEQPPPARRRVEPAPPGPAAFELAPVPVDRLPYPPALELLHDRRDGPYRYFLPRQAEQLIAWGEILQNCLGDHVVRARTGQSLIVGQFDGARLIGALELGPRLDVRQFSGLRNARLSPAQRASFHRVLTDVGLRGVTAP